jgi:GNAT superfamily N-acetyltransferase
MSNFKVRRYKDIDNRKVFRLHTFALKDATAFSKHGHWDEDFKNIEKIYLRNKGEFLVGILDNKLVSIGALKKISENNAEIKRMRTHPKFQRRGFAQIILNKLEEKARKLGYGILQLDTTIKQTAAQKFYQKNGYREVKRGFLGGFKTIYYRKIL